MLSPSEDESLLEAFAVQLVEILIDVPLKWVAKFQYTTSLLNRMFQQFREETALLHMECVQNLILLLFTAASAYLNSNESTLFKCLMLGPGALHAGLLTRTLLQHYCQQQKVPVSWLRKPEEAGSVVVGLASMNVQCLYCFGFK